MDEEEYLRSDELLGLSDEEIAEYVYAHTSASQWQRCSMEVLDSLCFTVFKLSLSALLKRFLLIFYTKGLLNDVMLHLTIIASGLYIVGTQSRSLSAVCIYVALISVPPNFSFLLRKHFGLIMLLYSVSLLLLWQYIFTAEEFMSMRGTLMIMLMKITSLSFDLANESTESIHMLSILSYLLDGSTVIFGPWITYKQFKDSFSIKQFKQEIMNCFCASTYIALSLFFIVYSSCIADRFSDWPVIGAYFVAQSFRFSHYFVSWFSAGISLLSGVDSGVVTEWIHIEWPRSLVDVVVSWNIPMHRFLHKYVFRETRKYGSAIAIFITYAVSSLLHGINFQLSAVLLSLGFYTFAETRLRSKMSRRMNSCVRARKCCNECQHVKKENALCTLTTNTVFRILAIIHLVYLGMVFDDSAAEIGYSWKHTLNVWAHSYYYSHIVGIFTMLLSLAL